MAWVEFRCLGSEFESVIANKMVENGWERCATGSTWVKPTWSPRCVRQRIYYLPSTRTYTEISSTAYQYTIYEPELREHYSTGAGAGAGNGWAGWGNPVYWTGASRNETSREYAFEGWIDDGVLIGIVKPDPTMANAISFMIWAGAVKGFDGFYRLMALDAMPSANARRIGQRLIYADDNLGYFFGFVGGGIGVSSFDRVARLSKVYVIRGGTSASVTVSFANVFGELVDRNGIPYVLCSNAQGMELTGDLINVNIGGTVYTYKLLNPNPSPSQAIYFISRFDSFDQTYTPSQTTASKLLYLWVRYE